MRRPAAPVAGMTACAAGLLYSIGYHPSPIPFDEFLAMPIAKATADPGLYSNADLLVASGARTPFYVYRALGSIHALGVNLDVLWYAAFAVSLLALFASVYFLARAFAAPATAALVTLAVACSDASLGTVHWSWMPHRNFVSASAALPFVLVAVGLALRKRSGAGLLLASAAFWLHPGLGLAGASTCALLLVAEGRAADWKRTAAVLTAALAIGLTHVVRVQSAIGGLTDVASAVPFADQFALFAWHAFVGDHWQEGVGLFVIGLGSAVMGLGALAADMRRRAAIALAWLLVLCVGWTAYAQWGRSPALLLLFLVRASVILKPLCWALAGVWALSRVRAQRTFMTRCGATALALTAVQVNLGPAEGFAALGVAALLVGLERFPARRVTMALLTGAGALAFFPSATRLAELFAPARVAVIVAAVLFLGAACVAYRSAGDEAMHEATAPSAPLAPARPMLALAALFAAALITMSGDWRGLRPASAAALERRLRFSAPADSSMVAVERWARDSTPRGSMFLVSPTDDRFVPFRVRAQRSVYIQYADVNQLAYDLQNYPRAFARLTRAGVRMQSRHQAVDSGYESLSADTLQAIACEGVSYAIFPTGRHLVPPLSVVFRDTRWTAYALGACAER